MSFNTEVRSCFGHDVADYVSRKLVGGSNGKKGARYEDFFSAYRVSEEIGELIKNARELPSFHQQAEAFVDDLVVSWGDKSEYFQCKNAAQVSWTAGKHPIKTDFALQVEFCASTGRPEDRTTLVVVSEEEHSKLVVAIPKEISSHTRVEHFPYCDGSMNRLVIECEKLRDSLTMLTRVADPSDDEIVNALGALILGLLAFENEVKGEEIVAKAQAVSPHLIRLLPHQEAGVVIHPMLRPTLDAILGLQCRIDRGFFSWSAYGMECVFPGSCLSEEFAKFQRRVVENAPSTVEEFEVLS